MDLAIIALAVFTIGVSVGLSGYGGFLIPPLLVGLLGMGPTAAIAHALCSFVLPGIVGSVLYQRRSGHRHLAISGVLAAGALPGIFAGRLVSASLSDDALRAVLGVLVLLASLVLAYQAPGRRRPDRGAGSTAAHMRGRHVPVIVAAGFIGGIAAVTAGIGGPLFMVPILAMLGLNLAAVVGAALLTSAPIAVVGAASLLSFVSIDPTVLLVVTIAQLLGVPVGVALQRRIAPAYLIPAIAGASAIAGSVLLYRALTAT